MVHLFEMIFDSGEDLTFILCWKKVWLLIYLLSFGQKTGFLKHILRTFVKAVHHFDLIWYSAVIPILIDPHEGMVKSGFITFKWCHHWWEQTLSLHWMKKTFQVFCFERSGENFYESPTHGALFFQLLKEGAQRSPYFNENLCLKINRSIIAREN